MYKYRNGNIDKFDTDDLAVCEARCEEEPECGCWHIAVSFSVCFIGKGCYGDPLAHWDVQGGHKAINPAGLAGR